MRGESYFGNAVCLCGPRYKYSYKITKKKRYESIYLKARVEGEEITNA